MTSIWLFKYFGFAIKKSGIYIGVCLCLTTLAAGADQLAELKLSSKATELLAGRLTVRVPLEGIPTDIQKSIMAAPEANEEMSRIEINAGNQRMVLMAYELFARTDKDFETGVKQQAALLPGKPGVEPWPLAVPLRAYACVPSAPAKRREATFILGIYVAQADGSVQQLDFFINLAAATNLGGALELAKSIARTIATGKTKLNTTAGERRLRAYGRNLNVTVPDGYVTTRQQGPDFEVHHIHKITPFPGIRASIGVYLGDHPSSDDDDAKSKGMTILFGTIARWYEKSMNEGGQTALHDRALVRLKFWPFGDGPTYADVFLVGKDAEEMDELKKIAATLRLVEASR